MPSKRKSCTRFTEPVPCRVIDGCSSERPGGFTLLEVLVAVTIFAIISMAVYSTFRAGLKSYEAGEEQMEVIQSARVAFDLLTRDLRSLYYRPPGTYNQQLIRQRQMRHMQQLQASQMPGVRNLARGLRGKGHRRDADQEEEEKPLPGVPIDLSIVGVDGDDFDSLTFVTYQPNWGSEPVEPWALARVKYWVDEQGNLLRSEGPISVDDVPAFQWRPPAEPGAEEENPRQGDQGGPDESPDVDNYLKDSPQELIVRNVKSFDIEYGYWAEDGWFQAPEWVSYQRRFRHPPPQIDPLDPRAAAMNALRRGQPTDDVPAYVTVTLRIGYGPEHESTRLFRTRIRLPNSSETYVPLEALFHRPGPAVPGRSTGRATPFGRTYRAFPGPR